MSIELIIKNLEEDRRLAAKKAMNCLKCYEECREVQDDWGADRYYDRYARLVDECGRLATAIEVLEERVT